MVNSTNTASASTMSAKNSSVVSSSKSAAPAARSNSNSTSVAKKSANVAPRKILPLDKRTSVKKVRDNVELLNITEKTGSKIEVYLVAPSYREAEQIDDGRQAMTVVNGQTYLNLTTPRFQERLFKIMRNLEVDGKPQSTKINAMWSFADDHIEAFNWIIGKANSFLTDYFNPSER